MPAYLIQGDNRYFEGWWYDLGEDNFYMADANLEMLRLEEGVKIKFKAGRAIKLSGTADGFPYFTIKGTAENPVILDSELGTPGTWGGMYLAGRFTVDHLIIKNGGQFTLADNLNGLKANIVSAYNGFYENSIFINFTTVENSADWGIIIAPNSINYDYENPAQKNIFLNNPSRNVIDLN